MTRVAPVPTTTRRIERRPRPPVDPAALAIAVATAYLEVRAGRRRPAQLDPLLTPAAQRRLNILARRQRRLPQQPSGGFSIQRVTTCRPHADALELVAIVREGDATTAVAVRADRRRGRWWITDVGTPEDRQPLVPPGAPIPAPKVTGSDAHEG
jgi:hypothetical protein